MANSQRYTREIPHRFRFEGQKFRDGYVTLANRYVSPETGSKEFESINISKKGKILSYTIIRTPANDYKLLSPYAVAIIETSDGARLTAMVTDSKFEDIKIGADVELVFRKIKEEGHSGIINYGYKAVIIL
ncbi:MAG: OB-fold domain-containing protein [Chloroherpetonaceae bacterium]|nr:OB-fold domain-containing protein [bacterium]